MTKYMMQQLRNLNSEEMRDLYRFKEKMGSEVTIDAKLFAGFDRAFVARMLQPVSFLVNQPNALGSKQKEEFLAALIDYEHISTFAHLVVAFGDFQYRNRTVLDQISKIGMNSIDGRSVSQISFPEPSGRYWDFHPWQVFAYSMMAGISPEAILGNLGLTMRTLAINSNRINMRAEKERYDLGHLLFAAAHLVPDQNFEFEINGKPICLKQVGAMALKIFNDVESRGTCMNFHLVEGLCACSAMVPGFAGSRTEVQEILDAQLACAFKLGSDFEKHDISKLAKKELEAALICLAHTVELAAFAPMFGFELSNIQKNAINFIINKTVILIEQMIEEDSNNGLMLFSSLEHFRRGVTLLLTIGQKADGQSLAEIDRAEYAVDFDKVNI